LPAGPAKVVAHALLVLLVTASGLGGSPAAAEAPADEQIAPSGRPAESEPTPSEVEAPSSTGGEEVDLERLLRLPSAMSFERQTRHGVSSEEWRSRFREQRDAIAEAQTRLDEARAELDQLSGGAGGGGQWQVAPPGSNNTEVTPMSFKLREQIRKGKEDVQLAEKELRALVIEADLAGVPPEWRGVE